MTAIQLQDQRPSEGVPKQMRRAQAKRLDERRQAIGIVGQPV